jgi:hypothetical protein
MPRKQGQPRGPRGCPRKKKIPQGDSAAGALGDAPQGRASDDDDIPSLVDHRPDDLLLTDYLAEAPTSVVGHFDETPLRLAKNMEDKCPSSNMHCSKDPLGPAEKESKEATRAILRSLMPALTGACRGEAPSPKRQSDGQWGSTSGVLMHDGCSTCRATYEGICGDTGSLEKIEESEESESEWELDEEGFQQRCMFAAADEGFVAGLERMSWLEGMD